MIFYRLLFIFSISLSIFSISASDIDYKQLSLQLQKSKKGSRHLLIYLELLETHHARDKSIQGKPEFFELKEKALELLAYNRQLSDLSMKYHADGCQQSLQEMRYVLDHKMSFLDEITERVLKSLSKFEQNDTGKTDEQFFCCNASKKLTDIFSRRSVCIEEKNYDCVKTSFDESSNALRGYDQCVERIIGKQKVDKFF